VRSWWINDSRLKINVIDIERQLSIGQAGENRKSCTAQFSEATALTNGLLSLVGALLAAEGEGSLRTALGASGRNRIELMIYGDRASVFVSDIKHLADCVGVAVEQDAERVILTVSHEDKSYSKV